MPRLRRAPFPSRPTSRPSSVAKRTILAIGLWVVGLSAGAAPAQVLLDEADAASTWTVGDLELRYAVDHPGNPAVDALLPVEVQLRSIANGYTAATDEEPGGRHVFGASGTTPIALDAEGLVAVLTAVVHELHDEGLYGVDVRPAASDFDLQAERDLRAPDRTRLALEIRIGRVAQVRTIAAGERVQSDWKIDNEIHERIRAGSPLQPAGVGPDGTTDLLDRRELEDYLHRLNRHSGRRVEAALSPGEEPGEVVLDYRVFEAKPWYAYGQVSNTGTNRTSLWQQRYGMSHRQLSDRDDVLSLEYLNTGGDDVHGVTARYQAPFFGSQRPRWMNRHRGDPEWLEWIPRDDIPWWGVDRLRWEVEFSWSRSEVGTAATFSNLANDVVTSRGALYGGRFIYETYQYRNLFIDLWGGLRIRDLRVHNNTVRTGGDAVLVLPRAGIHAERRNALSSFTADFQIEGQANEIDESNRRALGRLDTDDRFVQLGLAVSWSTYLEPLLRPEAWRDPSTHTSSTLAHELAVSFRSQLSLDDARVIPQANATLGGLYSVRGYPQSVAVGDDLYVGSIEYRFHIPRALPVTRRPLNLPLLGDFRAAPQQVYGRPDWDLVIRAFVDAGHTQRNASGGRPSEKDQILVSAGIGAELQILSNVRARLDYAVALTDERGPRNVGGKNFVTTGESEVHVLFSIVY